MTDGLSIGVAITNLVKTNGTKKQYGYALAAFGVIVLAMGIYQIVKP